MNLQSLIPSRGTLLAMVLSAATLALSACGGGGDGGTTADTPPPGGNPPPGAKGPAAPASFTLAYGTRSFVFQWSASAGATHYKLYEDVAGDSNFVEIAGDLANTRLARELGALHEHVNARYAVRACDAEACSGYSPVATLDISKAIGYFKASNVGASDGFGTQVVLSADGLTLAVGAPTESSNHQGVIHGAFEDNDLAVFSGAVYVFARTDTGWVQQAFLKAANAEGSDFFGTALSMSGDGDTLAVGASRERSSQAGVYAVQPADNDGANEAGAVYVFRRTGGTWAQQAYVKASNPEALDWFGSAVALSADGSTLAVSAPGEDSDITGVVHGPVTDNDLRDGSGAVYLFSYAAGAWTQQAYAKMPNAGAGDYVGASLALSASGDVLAVGAPNEDSNFTGVQAGAFADNNLASDSGAVYLFARAGGTWSQHSYVKSHAAINSQAFGIALALSGDGTTLAVGGQNESSDLKGVFVPSAPVNTGSGQSGAVYVFTNDEGTWVQSAFIKASNAARTDHFGNALDLSTDGDTLVVGAHWQSGSRSGITRGTAFTDDTLGDSSGAAYRFRRIGGNWVQQAYLKAANNVGRFQFGTSVAVSADGGTTAVGAIYENGGSPGVQGDPANQSVSSSGAVYLY